MDEKPRPFNQRNGIKVLTSDEFGYPKLGLGLDPTGFMFSCTQFHHYSFNYYGENFFVTKVMQNFFFSYF